MELGGDQITALFSNDSNTLWIGTGKNGLYYQNLTNGVVSRYSFANGQLENAITALGGSKNHLWVGTQKGVCKIELNSSTKRWYKIADGLPHNVINHLLVDAKEQVWITTVSNILICIEKGGIRKIPILSENGVASLGPIAETKDSTIWVGSYGGGIFRILNDSIAGLSVQEGLLSNYIYSLVADSNDYLWAGHRGGISKINLNNLLVKPLQLYAGIPGNCSFTENAVYSDARKQIWFGSNQGLWLYNPEKENQALIPPLLNITSIKINDREVDYTKSIVLKPGIYKVSIEYIGVHLSEPKHVMYQYQMLGYDREPEHSKLRTVYYPRLNDGNYTFELYASTGDGVVTPTPVIFKLTIRKPLWKYLWFWGIVSLIIASAIYVYIKRSEYAHQKEKELLEAKVTARTLELEQKNHLLHEKQKQITEQNQELVTYRNYLEQLVDERTKELLIAKNKAEESDRLKTAFLNNISHEFRTPLNAVCGFSKLMAESKFNTEQRNEFVHIINNNSDTLLQMLDEIIEISLIESNQDLVTNTSFNLHQLMLELEKQYQINNKKNISITYIPNKEIGEVELSYNRVRFRQVFTNLLFNAYKFTEKGKISFGYEKYKDNLRFFVADTGIGIAESELERIFEPFYKIESNNDKLYGGTGIGLTLCRKIVTQMGGTIWVDSVLNQGTVCYFTLPMTNGAEQT
jgi:signal transduction histidine kinase